MEFVQVIDPMMSMVTKEEVVDSKPGRVGGIIGFDDDGEGLLGGGGVHPIDDA